MTVRHIILSFLLFGIITSCSNTRFLPEDQLLYTGREKVEVIQKQEVKDIGPVKNSVKSITDHKVNNALFGRRVLPPVGLWIYNYWNVSEEKKFRRWIYNTLSKEPVLISEVNPDLRVRKIENDLFDLGHFNVNAWATVDTSTRNPRKAMVSYYVEIEPPYHYDSIRFDSLVETVDTLLNQPDYKFPVRSGDQYNFSTLKSARDELSGMIQNNGYYYFTPELIEMKADTSVGNRKLDLTIGMVSDLPTSVLSVYRINDITISITRRGETQQADTVDYGDLTIISNGDFVKHELLISSLYFKKGDIYSFTDYRSTLSRLNNLGIFSYVRISYIQSGSDSLDQLLDVRIDLSMADNITLDIESDLVAKSTGFTGPELTVGVTNNNAFRGAEKVNLSLDGGFEWQWGKKDSAQLGTFSYELGVTSGLAIPRLLLPESWKVHRPLIYQQTSVNLDFRLLNRTAYYNMFSSMVKLGYGWGSKREIQYNVYPFYLNSVNLLRTTPEFDRIVEDNIYIRKSFEEQFILGTRYEFIYDNTFRKRPINIYFHTGLNTSGNLVDLFSGIGKSPADRPYTFINSIYSQFIKVTTDFRYHLNGRNEALVFRLYAGIGIPYGNSTVLPYVEQFFSGGAYSIRGFAARYLGPGSYYEEDRSGYIDQSGDLKLEANLEYRFSMSKIVKGALFLETGNIWLVNEDENRPGAEFRFNNFYDELAVGTGFGLRFDFTIFVLRTDFGFPLRTPYINELTGKQWLLGESKFFRNGLFYLAIGYPF